MYLNSSNIEEFLKKISIYRQIHAGFRQCYSLVRPISVRECGFVSARIIEKYGLDPFYCDVIKVFIIYAAAVALVMLNHKLFGLNYSDAEGQKITYDQVCFSLNKPNAFQLAEIEIPGVNIDNCPRKDTKDWIKCKIRHLDRTMEEHFSNFGKLPQLTKAQASCIVAICNIHKYNQSLHLVSLLREFELLKKKEQNGFDSIGAYYKSCQKFPRRTRMYLKFVEDLGPAWDEFEYEHGIPKPRNGCLLVYTKVPSAHSSLKNVQGFHHCMLALSPEPINALGPAYEGSPLNQIVGFRCGNSKGENDNCGRTLFPGAAIISLIQLVFCRTWLNQNVMVRMPILDTRLKIGNMQPGPNFNPINNHGDSSRVEDDSDPGSPGGGDDGPPNYDDSSDSDSNSSSSSESEDENEEDFLEDVEMEEIHERNDDDNLMDNSSAERPTGGQPMTSTPNPPNSLPQTTPINISPMGSNRRSRPRTRRYFGGDERPNIPRFDLSDDSMEYHCNSDSAGEDDILSSHFTTFTSGGQDKRRRKRRKTVTSSAAGATTEGDGAANLSSPFFPRSRPQPTTSIPSSIPRRRRRAPPPPTTHTIQLFVPLMPNPNVHSCWFIASIRLAFHQRNWEGVPRTFGNTDDPSSFAALYQHLIINFADSNKRYDPMPLLKKFIQEYLPQYTVDHVMNTYWDSEFLFDKLLGHFEYTVDPNNPNNTIARRVIEACPAFRHIQPMVSTVKTRPDCCRENRVEKIATQGYINVVMDESHDYTIQELVEQQLNQTTVLNDGYQCPHCNTLLPRVEVNERLVETISALPIYLRNMERVPIEFGEDITIQSLNSGPIEFTLIGSIQFTGTYHFLDL